MLKHKIHSLTAWAWVVVVTAGIFAWAVPSPAQAAASLYFSPASGTYQAGQSVTVNVLLSTSEAANALSGTIAFDRNLMEVSSVSRSGSKVSFWVKDPSFSNSSGSVSFEGIIPNPGYTGSGGKIIGINFRLKGEGQATVRFTGGQVLANDGNGTNITGGLGSARFTVGQAQPPGPGVPKTPVITSPTHPDSNTWYANSDPQFKWSMPEGVTGVAATTSEQPNGDPGTTSIGTPSTLSYKNQKNGVNYLHVRFRNKQGWGPVAHYKFQVDKEAPSEIKLEKQDDYYALTAKDQFSGIDHYEWKEGVGSFSELEPAEDGEEGLYDFGFLTAGEHKLTIRAVDKAGNVADQELTISIPVPSAIVPNVAFNYLWFWILGGLLALLLILAFLHYRYQALPMAGPNAAYLALADDMIEQIRILEHAKAERKLTKEESKLLKHIHGSLQRVEKLIGPATPTKKSHRAGFRSRRLITDEF